MPPFAESTLDRRLAELGGKTPTRVLVVCGDAMRKKRGEPESARPEETERALSALSLGDAVQAVREADTRGAASGLARASTDAFEAAFADSDEERELFVASVMDGLGARDRLASIATAARARGALGERAGEDVAELVAATDELEQRLQGADAPRQAWTRSLTAANAARRAVLATLTDAAASDAWWYAARIHDDGLLAVLGGLVDADSVSLGEEGKRDVARSRIAGSDALDASAIKDRALGHGDAASDSRANRRSQSDASLREALALASDRSIEADADRPV